MLELSFELLAAIIRAKLGSGGKHRVLFWCILSMFLHPTGPRYDINGKFMNTLESKGSLAYVHRIELGSGHLLHLFGLVGSSWFVQNSV